MLSLVIMAAGHSVRYQYNKQIDPLYQEYSLLDFSIYDALLAGFRRIVLIIRKDQKVIFAKKYQKLILKKTIILVIQNLKFLPLPYSLTKKRKKPWGTAHCVYCIKNVVKENFALINCDDFYGKEAFLLMAKNLKKNSAKNTFFMIAYQVKNTLTPSGTVSRGICNVKENNLLKIEEVTAIQQKNNEIFAKEKKINPNSLVSMNFWGFTPAIQKFINRDLKAFLKKKKIPENEEIYLPTVIEKALKEKVIQVEVLFSRSNWFGLTYPQDKEKAVKNLQKLVNARLYPRKLW